MRKLDRQIMQGISSSYNKHLSREQVIQAPHGSTIMEGQIVQLPANTQPIQVQHNRLQQ